MVRLMTTPRPPVTVSGYMGSITFDGQAVTIRKSIRGRTRIYLAQISGISLEPAGIGMKAIRVITAGGTVHGRSRALGSHKSLARDPQALTFRSGRMAEFEAFADLVENARNA
jgi:hypothetical protein